MAKTSEDFVVVDALVAMSLSNCAQMYGFFRYQNNIAFVARMLILTAVTLSDRFADELDYYGKRTKTTDCSEKRIGRRVEVSKCDGGDTRSRRLALCAERMGKLIIANYTHAAVRML